MLGTFDIKSGHNYDNEQNQHCPKCKADPK